MHQIITAFAPEALFRHRWRAFIAPQTPSWILRVGFVANGKETEKGKQGRGNGKRDRRKHPRKTISGYSLAAKLIFKMFFSSAKKNIR